MKIFFGVNYGKDTSELDSSYLIWIIEKYSKADWNLIQECKKELSDRLKIEWTYPPKPLTEKEVLQKFKRDIIDRAYKDGISEDDCKYIAQGHTSWTPPKEEINVGEIIVGLLSRIDHLEKLICMAIICKGNEYTLDGYLKFPKLLEGDLQLIRNINQ